MSISRDTRDLPLPTRHLVEIAPPWTWAVALTSAGLLGALLILSVAGRIDVVVRGSGVIRPAEGERSIVVLRDGTIEYLLPAGTHVMKNQVLVRLQSLSAETELAESVREEIATTRDKNRLLGIDTSRNESFQLSLRRLIANGERQAAELRTAIVLDEERVRRADGLRAAGLLSADAVLDRREHLRQLRHDLV